MLARLQQAITLGALVLALAWAVWAWRAGHPAWAVVGVVLLLCGHALVLGLEFVLLARVAAGDAAGRAEAGQLLRAWAGESLAAPRVFCWRQPFRSRCWPDHLPAEARGRRGVLLVHGFLCNRGLWNRWMARLRADGVPFVGLDLEPVFGDIEDYAPLIERAVRRLEQATGLSPLVVAHSMGGLAVRHWHALPGNAARLEHVVTIGTPHHGTWMARFALSRNGCQMRLRSPWLKALAAREPASQGSRYTCYYGNCDNIVFPPSTAALPGADNRHLAGVAHVHMVERFEPWEALAARLAAAPGAGARRT